MQCTQVNVRQFNTVHLDLSDHKTCDLGQFLNSRIYAS